ncbi:3' exoribonuclease, RNase T-like [uncultured archaeon]|nr:3' exoribonuclease, RNase T-like [uncultured archaeon]
MSYSDVMLDIETLALKPNATVLSIAAVGFSPFENTVDFSNNPKLDLLLDVDAQKNRIDDDDTISWWSKQDPKIIEKIFSLEGRISPQEALKQLTKFCWIKQRI